MSSSSHNTACDHSKMNGSSNPDHVDSVWIYHERQEAALCGQHALNNLLQAPIFTAYQLSSIASQLDQLELDAYRKSSDPKDYERRLAEGSGNVDAAGNFSIQVLKVALQREYDIELPGLTDEQINNKSMDITAYDGFLCHKSDHWFGIRQVGGRFWNLNSMLEIPTPVGHFELAKNMQEWRNQGYTIFIAHGLPGNVGEKQKVVVQNGHCHNMSDLLRGRATGKDPWESMQGKGRRLDGTNLQTAKPVHEMTEDEQLAMALSASVAEQTTPSINATMPVEVPPEPVAGTPGAVRIQMKLPDGRRMVRRFDSNDLVQVIGAFAASVLSGKMVEVLAGFPPKPLKGSLTIDAAQLANQSIQLRYV